VIHQPTGKSLPAENWRLVKYRPFQASQKVLLACSVTFDFDSSTPTEFEGSVAVAKRSGDR